MDPQSNNSQAADMEVDNTEGVFFDLGERRVRVLGGSTDCAAAFQIDKEDHTLGNALRHMIMKNPKVDFCGYTIPHPSENRINLRIQTVDDYTAYEALVKGLDDLMDLCDGVTDAFTDARDTHSRAQAST